MLEGLEHLTVGCSGKHGGIDQHVSTPLHGAPEPAQ